MAELLGAITSPAAMPVSAETTQITASGARAGTASARSASAKSKNPSRPGSRTPLRSAMRPPTGDTRKVMSACGSRLRPTTHIGLVEHDLEVEGQQEGGEHHQDVEGQPAGQVAPERGDAKQRNPDQRPRVAPLGADERPDRSSGRGDQDYPDTGLRVGQAELQRRGRDHEQCGSEPVDAAQHDRSIRGKKGR